MKEHCVLMQGVPGSPGTLGPNGEPGYPGPRGETGQSGPAGPDGEAVMLQFHNSVKCESDCFNEVVARKLPRVENELV